MMKLYSLFVLAALGGSATAFTAVPSSSSASARRSTLTRLNMFGGAGAGIPSEDNPDKIKQMEQAARQMGMTLEEYKLGIGARVRFVEELSRARVKGGNAATVSIERDGNNPPKYLKITITDAGKALGKDSLSAELVKALKTASDASRNTRTEAQKDMMTYIANEMKKL